MISSQDFVYDGISWKLMIGFQDPGLDKVSWQLVIGSQDSALGDSTVILSWDFDLKT